MTSNSKSFIALFLFIALFVSCTKHVQKEHGSPEAYINNINKLIDNGDFYDAKFQVDSVLIFFPNDNATFEKGMACILRMHKIEAQKNLVYYDSLRVKNETETALLKKQFEFEPSAVSGLPGRYTHKNQSIAKTFNRSFIRGNVDENGKFFISSHYFSSSNINHTQIKIKAGDLFVISNKVPLGGGFNRRFNDGNGNKWEVVIYNEANDGGIFNFIAENASKKLTVEYIGDKNYTTVMPETDKKAIMDAQKLSVLIVEHKLILDEIAKAKKTINK